MICRRQLSVDIRLIVVFCAMLGLSGLNAQAGGVPYRFAYNGSVISRVASFPSYSSTQSCPDNHTAPKTGLNGTYFYAHCHPDADFGNVYVTINGVDVTITQSMSDLAWSYVYSGYDKVSGSTFVQNCFSYCTSVGVPMSVDAWYQFTDPCTVCTLGSKPKSTVLGETHCVTFVTGGELCTVTYTIEKNASGPVWGLTRAFPLYFNWVTGPGYQFSDANPLGQNVN
jgi:hypothetical protein